MEYSLYCDDKIIFDNFFPDHKLSIIPCQEKTKLSSCVYEEYYFKNTKYNIPIVFKFLNDTEYRGLLFMVVYRLHICGSYTYVLISIKSDRSHGFPSHLVYPDNGLLAVIYQNESDFIKFKLKV